MRQTNRKEKGFTLLEVIVALAITAVGIAAAARYTVSAATVEYETEQRMLAVWTAGNRLSELRIERAWPAPGGYSGQADMGGRTWYLKETVADTDQPNIRRVDIEVFADPNQSDREFNLYGYLARYLPPEEQAQGPGDGGPQEGDGSESVSGDEGDVPLPGDEPQDVPPGDEEIQPESDTALPEGESQDQPESEGGSG